MKTLPYVTAALLLAVASVAPGAAQSFDLSWFTMGGGGGTSTGATFAVSGTIGQPENGMASGGSYTWVGGFQVRSYDSSILIPSNAVWKYLADGSDQGTTWRAPNLNDSAWPSGAAQLGYGDGDETTVVRFGPDPNNKYITTYFRRAFFVANADAITLLRLRLLCDDGAVVYLNGQAVLSDNMPIEPVDYQTLAGLDLDDGRTFLNATYDGSFLRSGTNVLAVEVHQADPRSSDISFALEARVSQEPPLLVGAPQSLAVFAGVTAQFMVGAVGRVTSYRWYKDGVPLSNDGRISGADSAILSVADARESDAGFYTAVVANAVGAATSPAARLDVGVVLAAPSIRGGQVGFTFSTVAGRTYTVERKLELSDPVWIPVKTFAGTGGPAQFTRPPTNGTAFFRLRVD